MVIVENEDGTALATINGVWLIVRMLKSENKFEVAPIESNGWQSAQQCLEAFNTMENDKNYEYAIIFNANLSA